MNQTSITKNVHAFDLEERAERFARDCRKYIYKVPKTLINYDDIKQLLRSSGSVAANYIEGNEALSRKDFRHRIMITRKEAKESALWLRLITCSEEDSTERDRLMDEASQLIKIFGSILMKTT